MSNDGPLVHWIPASEYTATLKHTACGLVEHALPTGEYAYMAFASGVTCPTCVVWMDARGISRPAGPGEGEPELRIELADGSTVDPVEIVGEVFPEPTEPEPGMPAELPVFEDLPAATPKALPAAPTTLPNLQAMSEATLMRLGAFEPEDRPTRQAIEDHLSQQRRAYEEYSKEQLIDELISRDTNAIRRGQEVAEGKTAGKLLREFVRGVLYTADQQDLAESTAMLSKGKSIDRVLTLLGAEPASTRDLRINGGTTLGKIGPYGNTPAGGREAEIENPQPDTRQMESVRVAEVIRARQEN